MTDQSCPSKPVVKRVSEDTVTDHVSARWVHPPSTQTTELPPYPPLESSVPSAPPEKNILLLPKQAVPMPTSNRYADIYSSDSDNDPVFEETVNKHKTVNYINDLFQPKMSPTLSLSGIIENYLFIVGIPVGPILNKEFEFIFRSDRSDRTYVHS